MYNAAGQINKDQLVQRFAPLVKRIAYHLMARLPSKTSIDGAACIGEWIPKEKFLDVQRLRFRLDINGRTVQEASTADMLYSIDEIIAYISRFYTLKTGDILFTGTPAGVGPVQIDDHLEGYLEDRKVLDFRCK